MRELARVRESVEAPQLSKNCPRCATVPATIVSPIERRRVRTPKRLFQPTAKALGIPAGVAIEISAT